MQVSRNSRLPVNQLKKDAKTLFGIKLDRDKKDLFNYYYNMLTEWNNRVNLYPKGAEKYIFTNYFLDSLAIFKYLPIEENSRILDIGSGNGCPGVPIKMARWDLDVFLVESNHKKALFLQTIQKDLKDVGIEMLSVINRRIEEVEFDEKFDVVVSRATFKLNDLIEKSFRFVKKDGYLVYYAGDDADEQVKNNKDKIKEYNFVLKKKFDYKLPNMELHRKLIFLRYKGE